MLRINLLLICSLVFVLFIQTGFKTNTPEIKASDFVEYLPGNYPLLIAVPHDGTMKLDGVPERVETPENNNFKTGRDKNTSLMAKNIRDEIKRQTGKTPYIVIMKLSRKWVDANREAERAYDQTAVKPIYDEFFNQVNIAHDEILKKFGKGFAIDLHAGKWENAANFGTAGKNSLKNFIAANKFEAWEGPKSIQYNLSKAGYPIPGQNGIPYKQGPWGIILKSMTFGAVDKRMDGAEIEINGTKYLYPGEKETKDFSVNFTKALLVFMKAFYAK